MEMDDAVIGHQEGSVDYWKCSPFM